jgi:hypothetical protein
MKKLLFLLLLVAVGVAVAKMAQRGDLACCCGQKDPWTQYEQESDDAGGAA